jgi:hypothetical protein
VAADPCIVEDAETICAGLPFHWSTMASRPISRTHRLFFAHSRT